ncbi:MAG TPA: nucleotidyltransferase family protein [Acidobacteriaceae bacterium]|nr:nucleotidyltransferase family protein [Acidobacteriaceae bacterium]
MSIAAVVLAAGASRRLGRPKQNIVLDRETLLQRTVRLSREAGLSPVFVVVRKETEYAEIAPSPNLIVVVNHEAEEGIASSIRSGIAAAARYDLAGTVMLACDQPALRATHLRALAEDQQRLSASAYAGSLGVPAYFPVSLFSSLLQLHGDTGARSLLKNAHAIEAEELSLDIDTEDDLGIARALFETPGDR